MGVPQPPTSALFLAICGTRGGPACDLLSAACGGHDAGESRVVIRGVGSAARETSTRS